MDSFYKQLKTYGKVRTQESLAKHITYKIGGPAKYFITIKDISHIPELLRLIDGEGVIPFISPDMITYIPLNPFEAGYHIVRYEANNSSGSLKTFSA